MTKIVFVCVLVLTLAVLSAAAETNLLPNQFGPWQAASPTRLKSGAGLYQSWGDARTEGLREAGLVAFEERNYKNATEELTLKLYRFKDPSGAYEFFTQIHAPGMLNPQLGDEAASDQSLVRILLGNFVLTAGASVSPGPETMAELVAELRNKADSTPFPPLRTYLPARWRVAGSEKYVQGPEGFRMAMEALGQSAYADLAKEVGFELGAEAIFARYQGERGSGILLLLQYPTPQLAEQHLHHLEEALPATAKQSRVTVERKASLLSLVFAPTSPAHAQAIRDEVNYETEVTWNEPSHTATDPPLVVVMVKIFLFTGMFLGIATAVGIAFGGFRVIIKRLFPGKIFDRPQDIEVLQLGLTGKKIDPTDMY